MSNLTHLRAFSARRCAHKVKVIAVGAAIGAIAGAAIGGTAVYVDNATIDPFATLESACQAKHGWVCNTAIERRGDWAWWMWPVDNSGAGPTVMAVLMMYMLYRGVKGVLGVMLAAVFGVRCNERDNGRRAKYAPPTPHYMHDPKVIDFVPMKGTWNLPRRRRW